MRRIVGRMWMLALGLKGLKYFVQVANGNGIAHSTVRYTKGYSTIFFNPLSTDIKMHILLTVLHTFLKKLVQRICLNIKTSYP